MRALAIILLALLMVQAGGPMLVFTVQQQQIRHEIKQRIKAGVAEEDLVLLAIPKSLEEGENARFQRIHSREFRFDGRMYDIVRQEDRGDTTLYACILDEAETALFANLHSLIRDEMKHNPERQRQSRDAQRLLDSRYLAWSDGNLYNLVGRNFISPVTDPDLNSRSIRPPTPPPEYHS